MSNIEVFIWVVVGVAIGAIAQALYLTWKIHQLGKRIKKNLNEIDKHLHDLYK
jgi:peptidoglycan biosynthesis protein MviN/MurJ (putative lipid II flippase)